jgi:hypothetical protein
MANGSPLTSEQLSLAPRAAFHEGGSRQAFYFVVRRARCDDLLYPRPLWLYHGMGEEGGRSI